MSKHAKFVQHSPEWVVLEIPENHSLNENLTPLRREFFLTQFEGKLHVKERTPYGAEFFIGPCLCRYFGTSSREDLRPKLTLPLMPAAFYQDAFLKLLKKEYQKAYHQIRYSDYLGKSWT